MAKIDASKLITRLFNLIPILFAAFVSASFVWHFTASKTPFMLSFAGAFVYQAILFTVFNIARKPKHKIIFVLYFVAIIVITPVLSEFYEMLMASRADQLMDNIMIFDWFFGSGSYTLYNPGFCFALLMYMSLPIGAAIYFYTKVYLRISVLFLVALFPPVIYAKDYETYPPYLCAILMILFFLTVIYCRHFKAGSADKPVETSLSFPVSALSFIAIAIFVAIIIPKPDIDDKRQAFDEFTQGRFSSQYGRITDNFTSTSNGNNSGNTSNRVLAHIAADELLNLKTQCYYYYDDTDDVWLPLEQDSDLMTRTRYYMLSNYTSHSESEIEMYNPAQLVEDIIFACNKNEDFAEKYNLESLIGKNANLGNYESNLSYVSVNEKFCPSYFFVPENAYNLKISTNSTDTTIIKSDSGVLYPIYEPNGGLLCYKPGYTITIDYISPQFIKDNRAQSVLRALSYEEYGKFLSELNEITDSQVSYKAYLEYEEQNEIFESESERVFSRDIRELAQDITDGLYSDYEKAKAIEQYFAESGYKYDAEYICPNGENITHFIFDEQQGSCYHFATAMTLMCRSVGLNARYCEGFSYSERASQTYLKKKDTVYIIDESCSHAFCEVYISGYGWMRFEPTVPDDSIAMGSARIALAVLIMLIIAVVFALIFTKYIYPVLERIYLKHLSNTNQCEKLCRYIMNSLKKSTDSTTCDSAFEVSGKAFVLSDMDISLIANCFNKCIYGMYPLEAKQMLAMTDMMFEFRKAYACKRRQLRKQNSPRRLKYTA